MVHKLIDAGRYKAHKLCSPARGHHRGGTANAKAADQPLGERRVYHPLRSKPLLQACGRAKHAAADTDVLAEHDDTEILLHGPRKREIDGFDKRHLSHRTLL